MELVTGYRGADHVTAEQLGDLQAGFAGYEHCVLPCLLYTSRCV